MWATPSPLPALDSTNRSTALLNKLTGLRAAGHPLLAPALVILLVFAAGLAGRWTATSRWSDSSLLRAVEEQAGQSAGLNGFWDATFTFADVAVRRTEAGGLGLGLGNVTLVVPRGFSARYDLTIGYTRNSSRNFRIISDVELDEERTSRWDSSWGSPRRFIYGTGETGDGDYRVEIRTTNGNITIRER